MLKILNNYQLNASYEKFDRTILIGNFDGVHLGHQSLISKAISLVQINNTRLGCITFAPHSRNILNPRNTNFNLFNINDKCERLFNNGIEEIFLINDLSFFQHTAKIFIEDILIKQLNCKYLVVGKDFKFGAGRAGDINLLKEYDNYGQLKLLIVSNFTHNNQELKISSSHIRNQLSLGNINLSNNLLGYSYYIKGKLIIKKNLYNVLNIAKIIISLDNVFFPKTGVYLCDIKQNHINYQIMINISLNVILKLPENILEILIYNYNYDLNYGEIIILPKKYIGEI